MEIQDTVMPKSQLYLGYAGLFPQMFCLALLFTGDENRWFALTGGFGYAAMIFSFLGGIWWGQAMTRADSPAWISVVAIGPSLISFAAYMPWALGWEWPGPSLVILGLCISASPLIDRKIGRIVPFSAQCINMRWILSVCLGGMTVILGLSV
jgi:Protein of unknown function (DUF3429)